MAPAPRARAVTALVLSLVLLGACTFNVGRDGNTEPGERLYRVKIEQSRRGEGLAKTPDRTVSINAKLIERSVAGGMSIVVDDVDADGEESQVESARRLRGKSITVRIGAQGIEGISLGLSEDPDLNAADIALLFQVVSPLVPGKGRATPTRSITGLAAPWSEGITLDVTHRDAGRRWVRWVLADVVSTTARGRLTFRLPIARSSPPSGGGRQTALVDEVFQSLFGPGTGDGTAAQIAKGFAAIPFAIAAPFLAITDALTSIFGGSRGGETRVTTIPLAGEISLEARTAIGGSDARELSTTGRGSMRLTGELPRLEGEAASLSEKPLTLSADWVYSKSLVNPWPFGPLLLAIAGLVADLVLMAFLIRRRRAAV